MSIVNEVFGSGLELYSFLTKKAKVKNAIKRLLIRELRNNLKRLEHRNNKGVNRGVLIDKLQNETLLNAIEEGFNLNSLASKQKVDAKVIAVFKKAERYEGWNAEKLMLSIDEKIVSLKETIEFYDNIDQAPINLTSRLNNLYILLVLMSLLIKISSDK